MTIAEVNKKYNVNLPEILMPDEIGNPEKWEKEGMKSPLFVFIIFLWEMEVLWKKVLILKEN